MANGNNGNRTATGKRVQSQPVWRLNTRNDSPVFWSDIDPGVMRLCIDAVARSGGAIMLGTTSDGGAYSICVLSGNEKAKDYPHSKEECEATLKQMADWFVALEL